MQEVAGVIKGWGVFVQGEQVGWSTTIGEAEAVLDRMPARWPGAVLPAGAFVGDLNEAQGRHRDAQGRATK